jgi:hypothetical protein
MRKFLLKILIFILPAFLFNFALVWIYEAPQRQALKNGTHDKLLKWSAIKSSEKLYNTVIIGSSRGYYAYNPMIIDSISNTNSYNMCTPSQNIIESYYILKEIFKYQKPGFVIYEIFLPSFSYAPVYYHILGNAEFMSTKGKWDMILNGFGSRAIVNVLLPILKYKLYINNDIERFYKPFKSKPNNSFWINGYLYDDNIVDSMDINNFPPVYSFETENVSLAYIESNLNLLNKLCKDNNAKLICVRAPYPPTRLKNSPPDTVHKYFKEFLSISNIPFFDFNYQLVAKYTDFDFTDYHHMNNKGASKVSKQLGEILIQVRTNNNVY